LQPSAVLACLVLIGGGQLSGTADSRPAAHPLAIQTVQACCRLSKGQAGPAAGQPAASVKWPAARAASGRTAGGSSSSCTPARAAGRQRCPADTRSPRAARVQAGAAELLPWAPGAQRRRWRAPAQLAAAAASARMPPQAVSALRHERHRRARVPPRGEAAACPAAGTRLRMQEESLASLLACAYIEMKHSFLHAVVQWPFDNAELR